MIDKYCKVSKCLHVPVHAIAMNDVLSVPKAFFDEVKPAEYLSTTKSKNGVLGRAGEDTVFEQEQERLASVNATLSKLVIPSYKLRAARGYDILTYKENGMPMFIEVKTSEKKAAGTVQLTKHEYDTARQMTEKGYEYWIYNYSVWGTENQHLEKISFRDLMTDDRVAPVRYICDIKARKATENGILHFRKKMGYSQIEAANMLEIPASCLCKYETGENQCPIAVYQKLTRLYQVTIDELLCIYPSS